MNKTAFTMIELVFVVVILGILATVAVPKMLVTRDDAIVSKARSTISAIQAGIETIKARNILTSNGGYPTVLDTVTTFDADNQLLFYNDTNSSESILQTPVISKKDVGGNWVKTAANTYDLYLTNSTTLSFTYSPTNGRFKCDYTSQDCKDLIR